MCQTQCGIETYLPRRCGVFGTDLPTESTRGERLDALEGMFESVPRDMVARPSRCFGVCADHRRHVSRLPKSLTASGHRVLGGVWLALA